MTALNLDKNTTGPYAYAYNNWVSNTALAQRTPEALAARMDLIYADQRESEMRTQNALSTLKMLQPDKGDAVDRLFATPSSSSGKQPAAGQPSASVTTAATVTTPRPKPQAPQASSSRPSNSASCSLHPGARHSNAECYSQGAPRPPAAPTRSTASTSSSYHTANSDGRSSMVTTSSRDATRALQARKELATGQAALEQHLASPSLPQRRVNWEDQRSTQRQDERRSPAQTQFRTYGTTPNYAPPDGGRRAGSQDGKYQPPRDYGQSRQPVNRVTHGHHEAQDQDDYGYDYGDVFTARFGSTKLTSYQIQADMYHHATHVLPPAAALQGVGTAHAEVRPVPSIFWTHRHRHLHATELSTAA